ncbi:hypothetical protein A2160_00915 [Candidatus Beckwithbacteria bacterium RBG_13_42_9]|uniref:YoaR-like putative peptidoglycan binding domain-containing protein n=1 Tax=Candidatus Beckwithbacteria bacterium RBG_13_42_9 TaxID=1797457 RepID=A0A1F5E339_9BACT|nr:MAG: hypothetical protein A2160_00915 [Candidatus Beckwithbacteria bacterium RBG_13_42_9]
MIHANKLILQLKKAFIPSAKKNKKTKAKPSWIVILLILLTLLPADLTLAYAFVFRDKIYPNVHILDQNLGGYTPAQAQEQLKPLLRRTPTTISLIHDQQNWQIDLKDLGLIYDLSAASQEAYQFGRDDSLPNNLLKRWQLVYQPQNLPMMVNFDQRIWEITTATIAAQINQPTTPPTITIVNNNQERHAQVKNGQPGKQLDSVALIKTLKQSLSELNHQSITLPVTPILPQISQAQAEVTRQRAELLLNKSILLEGAGQEWALNDEALINFLGFTNNLNEAKIASWTAQLATSLDHPAQNALFRFENGKVTEFKPATDGHRLDQKQTIKQIIQAIETIEKGSEPKATVELVVQTIKPEITTQQVNNLGIKELIGKGESFFAGSIAGRINNINLASQKISGTLIAPGETFSFNQAVGEIDQAHGFQQAYIIKEGRTVLGDGGGVCQVSTTLFRAVLNAGLPIEERRAHAYRVGYYEQNSPVGLDATVFSPTDDFKFKNDTSAHILIQTNFNPNQAKLTFELYGTSDGRKVTISVTRIWDQAPPPPDLYQDDPTLPNGTIKQVDWSAWGAKAAFDWKVVRNGETLQERTFYSVYRPWQAVFLRGVATP